MLFAGVFMLLIVGLTGVKHYANKSSTCGFCHEMQPEIVTWMASSHSKVECKVCHGDYLGKVLSADESIIKRLSSHYQNNYLMPITVKSEIPDTICTGCHRAKRHISPSGDLIIPHDKHERKKINCTECHRGVAHGNIVIRQVTIDGNFARWTPEYGKEQMVGINTGLAMTSCLDCHRQKAVTTACEACHREIVKPNDHKAPDWSEKHGKLARNNITGCDKCHSITTVFEITNFNDPVMEYVQTNTLCWQCHKLKPAGHTEKWSIDHGFKATSNREGCMICHNRTRPLNSFKGAKTFCMDCHNGRHQNFNKDTHPVPVALGTKPSNLACGKCHNINVCAKCHVNLTNSSEQRRK